jgi:hypothetical protein
MVAQSPPAHNSLTVLQAVCKVPNGGTLLVGAHCFWALLLTCWLCYLLLTGDYIIKRRADIEGKDVDCNGKLYNVRTNRQTGPPYY